MDKSLNHSGTNAADPPDHLNDAVERRLVEVLDAANHAGGYRQEQDVWIAALRAALVAEREAIRRECDAKRTVDAVVARNVELAAQLAAVTREGEVLHADYQRAVAAETALEAAMRENDRLREALNNVAWSLQSDGYTKVWRECLECLATASVESDPSIRAHKPGCCIGAALAPRSPEGEKPMKAGDRCPSCTKWRLELLRRIDPPGATALVCSHCGQSWNYAEEAEGEGPPIPDPDDEQEAGR